MFIIQNIETEFFLKHNGSGSLEHPYVEVACPGDAEAFTTSLEQAKYAVTWYCDMFKKWRIIDVYEGKL
ncbi:MULTISPECIES: hypothetical protein [Bacillus]|uniref:Uncharacterized protein n=1 Tax=Bacillus glycinifermentans TaxID=1664069 RepID=A0AAJ3YYE7_9BACI|nr:MULTISPECIES: hypothetical protein [Bacillus]HWO76392.1 hypothetical protein [Bacillus sp. (in: firmicutes)]MDU0069723.1 hypothetical protein [Bacillus sp. IG6]MED8018008.1 hypothetical protein [Bacillus glycinifermentans]QAT65416.1 hypothetical protein EQZ20_11180 [Bacillus glycinifermentans]WKB79420.1 hypothetical protein QYM22_11480 [Bacillus glycinifermentans]